MFNKNETWWSTTFKADGTARTSIMRRGDAPDADDKAWEMAVDIADRLRPGEDPTVHFNRTCMLPTGEQKAAAETAYNREVHRRTVPGDYRTSS